MIRIPDMSGFQMVENRLVVEWCRILMLFGIQMVSGLIFGPKLEWHQNTGHSKTGKVV